MKKILLFISVAVLVFGVTSCNSKSERYEYSVGSLESYMGTKFIINYDGAEFTPAAGAFPEITAKGGRQLIELRFRLPDESPDKSTWGPNVKVPIYLDAEDYYLFETYLPVEKNEAGNNDPLVALERAQNQDIFNVTLNYLTFTPHFYIYAENKGSDQFSKFQFDLEVDEELVPGVKNDTINVRLKHFANRAKDEKPYDLVRLPLAFDISRLPNNPAYGNIQIKDENEENITYIIKMTYACYQPNDYGTGVNEEEILTKFVTVPWTPGDPYGQDKK